MNTIIKFFMISMVSLFASIAMAETQSILPVSQPCAKELQPLLKRAGITFDELQTQSGALKFSRANKNNITALKNAHSVCKKEPALVGKPKYCNCDDTMGTRLKNGACELVPVACW